MHPSVMICLAPIFFASELSPNEIFSLVIIKGLGWISLLQDRKKKPGYFTVIFKILCIITCRTPIQRSIESKNNAAFNILLEHSDVDYELQNSAGETALWLALASVPPDGTYPDNSYAAKLLAKGASANALNEMTGKTHMLIIEQLYRIISNCGPKGQNQFLRGSYN